MKFYQAKDRDGDPRIGIVLGLLVMVVGSFIYSSGGLKDPYVSARLAEISGFFVICLGGYAFLQSAVDQVRLIRIDRD